MKNLPRLLPVAGIAIAGVLAVKLISGVTDLPTLFSGAKAFAEEALKGGDNAAEAKDKTVIAAAPMPTPAKPAPVCAPTAAELAKEAGLSPAELSQLQNLGARRDQLDQREAGFDTNIQLMAAAEAKVDAKLKQLADLKTEIGGLLHQVDTAQDAEINRMVAVYSAMKPKDAAARFTILDDSVRLPVAARMKERTLAAILAQMPPADAKKLTESLAQRFAGASAKASAALATPNAPPLAGAAPAAPPPAQAANTAQPPAAAAPAAPPAKTPATAPKKKLPAIKPKKQAKTKPPKAEPQLAANRPPKPGAPPPENPATTAAATGDTSKPPAATPAK
jgi:flagellar motility protein MotE (MotC chaperone)